MTGKLIAVANMKGGVGKTTTVVSLAEALSADDARKSILVVDLDPQASASLCLAGDEILSQMIENGQTVQDILEQRLTKAKTKLDINSFVRRKISLTMRYDVQLAISLIPCGTKLRAFEKSVIYSLTKRKYSMNDIEHFFDLVFKTDFRPLAGEFDFVIFDCPPSISPISEVAIRASDLIIVPTIPDRISTFGLDAFCNGIWRDSESLLPPPPKPYVLISRKQNNKHHDHMVERMEAEVNAPDAAFGLFKTRIPQSAQLADALGSGAVLTFTRRYGSSVTQILQELVDEVKELVHADRH